MALSNSVPRALVIEDNARIRRAVAAILHLQGFGVSASDVPVPEALESIRSGQPDLLVLDVALIGMEGVAIIAQVETAAPDAVVVVLTELEGVREAALAAGAAHVINLHDLRHLRACVQQLGSVTACDCCVVAQAENRSSPAIGGGGFRITSGPTLPAGIARPDDTQRITSTEAARRPRE